VSAEEIDDFVKYLMKSREDWQVNQAKEAIQLFIYITSDATPKQKPKPTYNPTHFGGRWREK